MPAVGRYAFASGSVDPSDVRVFPDAEGVASTVNSALLVMDVQRDVVAIADDGSGYLPRLRGAIDGARAAGGVPSGL